MVKAEYIYILAVAVLLQRLVELYIARKNRIWMQQAGAKEFGVKHYPLFFMLHSLWLAGWVGESLICRQISSIWYFWFSLFLVAQCFRYWCMFSLGKAWNTRILVIPGEKVVKKGPYRLMKHPNYVTVAIELLSIPMLFDAFYTAVVVSVLNGWLLLGKRIPEEEQALKLLEK